MEERYIVKVNRPDGISKREMIEYIRNAVECWGGFFSPDNPLFNCFLNCATTVRSISKKRLESNQC